MSVDVPPPGEPRRRLPDPTTPQLATALSSGRAARPAGETNLRRRARRSAAAGGPAAGRRGEAAPLGEARCYHWARRGATAGKAGIRRASSSAAGERVLVDVPPRGEVRRRRRFPSPPPQSSGEQKPGGAVEQPAGETSFRHRARRSAVAGREAAAAG